MSQYDPCSNCMNMADANNDPNVCDGCFWYEYGCTEDEFYGYSEANSPSECDSCLHYACKHRILFEAGYKCVYEFHEE